MRGTIKRLVAVGVIGLAVAGCQPWYGTVRVHEHRDFGLERGPIGEGSMSSDTITTYTVQKGAQVAKVNGSYDEWFRFAQTQTIWTVGSVCAYTDVHRWGQGPERDGEVGVEKPYDRLVARPFPNDEFEDAFGVSYRTQYVEYIGCGGPRVDVDGQSAGHYAQYKRGSQSGPFLSQPLGFPSSNPQLYVGTQQFRNEYDPDFDDHDQAWVTYDLHRQ